MTTIDEAINSVLGEVQDSFESISYREPLALHLMELEQAHQFLFDQSVNPVGQAWPDISESTKRAKGRDDILIDTETLMRSLTSEAPGAVRRIYPRGRDWTAIFGTSVPYSAIHNFGLGIDQREHVGTTDHLVDQLTEDLADWAVDELKRSGETPAEDLFS